jgi:hypothetical protein
VLPARGGSLPRRAFGWVREATARQWLAALALAIAAVLLLSAIELRRVDVSLNVSADFADLVVAAPAQTNELVFADLIWTGDARITPPGGAARAVSHFEITPAAGPVEETGRITLAAVPLAADARFTVRADPAADRYTITFDRGAGPMEIFVPAGAAVAFDTGEIYRNANDIPERIVLDEFAGPIVLTGTRPPTRGRLAELLPVRALDFWDVMSAGGNGEARISTVRGGLLVIEGGGGRRVDLREGEPLVLGAVDGLLRSIALEDAAVRVQYDGPAEGIRSGYTERARSLMPSRLDWLTNIPWVKAALAIIAVFIGSALPRRRIR